MVTRSIIPRAPALAAAILRCGSHLEPLVAVRPQAAGNPVQVRLGPVPDLPPERTRQDLGHRVLSLGLSTKPLEDWLLPGIALTTLLLLLGSEGLDLTIEPPGLAGLEAHDGLGPQLIPVTHEFLEAEPPDLDRPEAAVAGLVRQVGVSVGRAGEDTLSRKSMERRP
jgi:hypothetical protein